MKITLLTCIAIFFAPLFANALEVPDSGFVRIRVDRDAVVAGLNGVPVLFDSDGNRMAMDSWFTLRVAAGLHFITLSGEGYQTVELPVAVKRDEVTAIELSYDSVSTFAPVMPTIDDTLHAKLGRVAVFSDPTRAALRLDELDAHLITPSEVTVPAGDHAFSVSAEGFEPLTQRLALSPDSDLTLNFLLRAEPPSPLSAEEMGMEYKPLIPLIDEAEADRLRRKFNSLAETFAIIPLGQGVLAKLILGKDESKGADILIISGAGLTAGTYLLGRILSSKKRSHVRTRNQTITLQNKEASENNKNIDQVVREKNAEARSTWELENQDRGRVEVLSD